MTEPVAHAWLDPAVVVDGVPGSSPDGVERHRVAAAAYVERVRPDLAARFADATVPADVLEGAVLLAARLHARKGSPVGLAGFGEFGPAEVVRFDPDVDRLLGIGRHGRPVAR